MTILATATSHLAVIHNCIWVLSGGWLETGRILLLYTKLLGSTILFFFMNFMIAYSLLNGELFSSEGFWSRSMLQRYNFSKVLVYLGSFLSISKIAFSSP